MAVAQEGLSDMATRKAHSPSTSPTATPEAWNAAPAACDQRRLTAEIEVTLVLL
jgi:hypothetical protein